MTEIVELDVGGQVFKTSVQTLTSIPESYLEQIFVEEWYNSLDDNGRYFIDRDPGVFDVILDYLRNGTAVILPPERHTRAKIRREAEFYGLPELIDIIDDTDDDRIITIRFFRPDYWPCDVDISLAQLRSVPGSRFACWFGGDLSQLEKDDQGRYLIEREHYEFAAMVAEFLNSGKDAIHDVSDQNELDKFRAEAKYFNIPGALHAASKVILEGSEAGPTSPPFTDVRR